MNLYDHLPFSRLEPVNQRRVRPGFSATTPPSDPKAFAADVSGQLFRAVEEARKEIPGFDPRLLLKVRAIGISPSDLEAIEGLTVISQEGKDLLILFAKEEGLNEFKNRLDQIARGEIPTRKDVMYAVKGWENWSKEDRIGPALRRHGIPSQEPFRVDVELWALERRDERSSMLTAFEARCLENGLKQLDRLTQETIIMYRLEVSRAGLESLLSHRDVRMVDLPALYQLEVGLTHLSVQHLPEVPPSEASAPGITVLDSGLNSNHPLLGPAVGDAQSFLPGLGPEDENGHGTMVAGLALYGDVEQQLRSGRFIPELRLFSGRITDASNYSPGFLENRLIEAVEYFAKEYGCKIFNLSIGDVQKPYTGGHVRGLAAVLDTLVRQYKVLFVVSAGNFWGTEEFPQDWRGQYPDYLLTDEARIIDPAPALNVLTVGSLAKYEQPRLGQRFPNDVNYQPVARHDQPSPFTRSGPGPGDAIKPEVVEYGGNFSVDLRTQPNKLLPNDLLGELSTFHEYIGGRLFVVDAGTSFAAPKVAHLAGRLLKRYPEAGPNLLRAFIVAHAAIPDATRKLLQDDSKEMKLVGYGKPDWDSLIYSVDSRVTLYCQEKISGQTHHFYEIPLPEDFFRGRARRKRYITVALAHMPLVRRTRIEYKGTNINFRVVRARYLDEILRIFRHTSKEEREALLPEAGKFKPTPNVRSKGTVQAATWQIKQVDSRWEEGRCFIIVTRAVATWAEQTFDEEDYALVVVLKDESEQVRYYTQVRQLLRARIRV
ncbi:MAG: S8 family peptidase [Firmicutes bacterium]|nr:S8 family peptidase [Bacillota bacterium]MCL5039783.1 S8 family peptidase [Bacillota bacterium]